MENRKKSISRVNPAIMENTECLIVKNAHPVIMQFESIYVV